MLTWVRKNSIEPNALVRHIAQESYRGTALAGFEPVTICFRDCFKMPREVRGGGVGEFE